METVEDEADSVEDAEVVTEEDEAVVSLEVVAEVSFTSPRLQLSQQLDIRSRRHPQCFCARL